MNNFLLILFQVTFIYYCVNGTLGQDLLVDTNVGQIRGLRAADGNYTMFMGIPYATVNESNPFGPATPQPKFEEVFDAYDDSAVCPQITEVVAQLAGSLDCLHLNVYVPDTGSTDRLPVLVYIFGGRFTSGFAGRSVYGPKFLMRHDVILVTLNYRMGPFGFMCLDIPEVPGNQGLKDQQLALAWVKNNIEAFGGDPEQITISGNSAGGMSVGLHVLSEGEKLFDKAILQSGTSFSPTFYEPVRDAPIVIARQLGFETSDIYEAISFLAATHPHEIITALRQLNNYIQFRPCIEKEFDGVENFLKVDWLRVEKIAKAENTTFLLGFTDDERMTTYIDGNDEFFGNLNILENKLPEGFDVDHEDFSGMKEVMYNFYFGDGELDESKKSEVTNFDSDFSFVYPTHRGMRSYLDSGAEKAYLYKFIYVGNRNFARSRRNITGGGAAHRDELGYLFDSSNLPEGDADDALMIDRMTTIWTNFVKYSNPTPQTSELLPLIWEPITKDSQYHYFTINTTVSVGTRPYNDRMAFWDLFYKANNHLQRLYPDSTNEYSGDSSANYWTLSYVLALSSIFVMIINN